MKWWMIVIVVLVLWYISDPTDAALTVDRIFHEPGGPPRPIGVPVTPPSILLRPQTNTQGLIPNKNPLWTAGFAGAAAVIH